MGRVRVGTASWTDRTLIESGWYPPEANTPEKRLRYYARQFPLVEVDATYYALPAAQTAAAWAARTPAGFTFNAKAFSLLTHHPTRVAALPADLRPAVQRAAQDRVYLNDVDPALADQIWERFLTDLAAVPAVVCHLPLQQGLHPGLRRPGGAAASLRGVPQPDLDE
jgi:uncharacterized protein YecE (DUF72 family)